MKADTDSSKAPEANDDLKSLSLPELEKKLESSPDGLSQAEAEKRLSHYGPNEIEEKEINAFLKFLSYFWGPIPWMIEAAVILSALARHANRGDFTGGLWGVHDPSRLGLGRFHVGYALVWFLINDRMKLLAYRVFDPIAEPLLPKKPANMTPQIAKRAYERYEHGGRQNGRAGQDWTKRSAGFEKMNPVNKQTRTTW